MELKVSLFLLPIKKAHPESEISRFEAGCRIWRSGDYRVADSVVTVAMVGAVLSFS
jgi:hypothetical protein